MLSIGWTDNRERVECEPLQRSLAQVIGDQEHGEGYQDDNEAPESAGREGQQVGDDEPQENEVGDPEPDRLAEPQEELPYLRRERLGTHRTMRCGLLDK